MKASSFVHLTIVGNKSDEIDKRMVSSDWGQKLARKFGGEYIESSACYNVLIFFSFQTMSCLTVRLTLTAFSLILLNVLFKMSR